MELVESFRVPTSDSGIVSFELVGSDDSEAYKLCSTSDAEDLLQCGEGTAFKGELATGALVPRGLDRVFLAIGKDGSPSVRPGVEFRVWPEEIVGEPADTEVAWTTSKTLQYPLAIVTVPVSARRFCVQVVVEGAVAWETVVFVGNPPDTVGTECSLLQ